jgi:hypothetical protein
MNYNKEIKTENGELGELLLITKLTEDIHIDFGYCYSRKYIFEDGQIMIFEGGNLKENIRLNDVREYRKEEAPVTETETVLKYMKLELIEWFNPEVYDKERIVANML